MKALALFGAGVLLLAASPAIAGMYTKGEQIACLTYNDFDTITDAIVKKQMQVAKRLIEQQRCLVMKQGLAVSVIESKGFLGHTKHLRVFLSGGDTINVWTAREEIEVR